jgi:competence protein ComEA
MQLSSDEARALAFIACLIGLALLGRWVDRPRPLLPNEETVDIAELAARSTAIQAEEAAEKIARRRAREAAAAPSSSPGSTLHASARAGAIARAPARGTAAEVAIIDLNRADAAELETLPGIGPALAARIVAYRDSAGRFAKPEQLDSVRGVGPALLARLMPLVKVNP